MNKEQLRLISLTEPREAKDGRSFYGASFQDPTNPFAKTVTRNFWQQKNSEGVAVWKGADPTQVKPFVGKLLPGYIKTAKVTPYEVTGGDGEIRTANIYTTVVLGAELEEQVFKALNHPLLSETVAEVAETVAEELEIA